MKPWVKATIERIEVTPQFFNYNEEKAAYTTVFNDLQVDVYRTGFKLRFNGIELWEPVEQNYFKLLQAYNESLLAHKIETYQIFKHV